MSDDKSIQRFHARNEIILEHEHKCVAIRKKNSEGIEHEVLMPLWADLGDNTETYFEAMNAAGCLGEAHRAIGTVVEKISSIKVRRRVLMALVEILTRHDSIADELAALEAERDRKLTALS